MSIKSLILLLPLLTSGVDAIAATTCAKNACYSQVSANRFAPSVFRSSGCYSFLASTISPTAATVTKTVAAGFERVTPGPRCATTNAPPSVKPAYASSCANTKQYVSACHCFGISKTTRSLKQCTTTVLSTTTVAGTTTLGSTSTGAATTSTVTGTSAATSSTSFITVPAPTGCSNQGLSFAVYDNTEVDSQTGYYNFEPSDFTTPVYTGSIGEIQDVFIPAAQAEASIYGQYVHNSTRFVLNHVAYIFAPQSGTYTFTASNVNDIFTFWIGQNAYSGYTRENNDLDTFVFFQNGGNSNTGIAGQSTFTVQLVGGLHYPIRYVFGQDVGAGTFNFDVTAPDGSRLFSPTQSSSPYLVRFSCDGAIAPAFPGFDADDAAATAAAATAATSSASASATALSISL